MVHRAVIFDLDGTLLDTILDLANSMNAVLHRHGYPTHDLDAYKTFVGDGIQMLVRRSLPEGRREGAIEAACLAEMREEYHRHQFDHTGPYPGISELLDGLVARSIRMAVLSNKPDQPTKALVAALLSRWRFDVVQGETPEIPLKPDPAGALHVAALLRVEPDQVLYVGDTDVDMKTARGAGMFAVGALWGFRGREELLANGARKLIESPTQLLALL